MNTDPGPAAAPVFGSQRQPAYLDDGWLECLETSGVLVDHDGLVLAANSEARSLLRRPSEEIVGQDAHDLLHRDGHGHYLPRSRCRLRDALLTGTSRHSEVGWFAAGDGTLLQLSWMITPYTVGPEAPGALVLFYEPDHARPRSGTGFGIRPLTEFDRLTLLAETTTQLTSTLDIDEALQRLAALAVPQLADWAVVDLFTDQDEVRRALVATHEDGVLTERPDLKGPMPPVPEESPMPLSRALRGAASSLAGPSTYHGPADSDIAIEQRRLFEETAMSSAAIAPIRGLRDVLGALTLGRSGERDEFTLRDLPLLEDITRRAGLALDNARLYQRQRKVAETMQRHLLPQLPKVSGLEMTARYLPAPHASYVGGDWYDVFALDGGAHALAIGDVVGHDLDAAAGMAQLRNMLRAFAWSQQGSPGAVVARLDEAMMHIAEVGMATVLLATITGGDGRPWRLHWTNAGHPPPLLLTTDGEARYLSDPHGILLGTGFDGERPDVVTELPPGATLLLYTDGLVESPHHSIDHGLDELRRHASALVHLPLESFSDALLDRARPGDNEDDVAVLALRVPGPGR